MKRKMVTKLYNLPLVLLKQYYQGKDRRHSATLTNVSDYLDGRIRAGEPRVLCKLDIEKGL